MRHDVLYENIRGVQDYIDDYFYGRFTPIETLLLKEPIEYCIAHELSENQRACLLLHYVESLSQVSIAGRLGITQPTVHKHISMAKDILCNYIRYSILVVEKVKHFDFKQQTKG